MTKECGCGSIGGNVFDETPRDLGSQKVVLFQGVPEFLSGNRPTVRPVYLPTRVARYLSRRSKGGSVMSKPMPRELIALTRTHQLLAEAKTFEDFKSIRDKAEAARLYAKSAKLGLEIQIHAAELKLECERRAGALISQIELSRGGRPGRKNQSQVATSLEDLGINKSQSSRWQDEARLPDGEYQAYVAACRAAGREPTSQGLLKRSRKFSGKELTRGQHRRSKKKHPSKSAVINPASVQSTPRFDAADDQEALLADIQLHHKQLTENLANYCGAGPYTEPTIAQRRYIGHLISEMAECLANLGNCYVAERSRLISSR